MGACTPAADLPSDGATPPVVTPQAAVHHVSFLKHSMFFAFDAEYLYKGDFAVALLFFSNYPNADEKMDDFRLLLGDEEVLHFQDRLITTLASSDETDLTGYQVFLYSETPPAGVYHFDTVMYSVDGIRYISGIGKGEIEIADSKNTLEDIYISSYTGFAFPPPGDREFVDFEPIANVGDVVIKGVDFGFLNEELDIRIVPVNAEIQKGQSRRITVNYTALDGKPINLVVKPWLIYEHDGAEKRFPMKQMVSLIGFTDEVIADILKNSVEIKS
jgi:hypothetical protein